MIKIIYTEKAYDLGNVGCQPFDIKVDVSLDKDARVDEAIIAFMELLKHAGYSEKCFAKNLKQVATEYYEEI